MNHAPDLSLDAVLAQMSERGRIEWELAVTKALLAQSQDRNAALLAQLEQATREERDE